MASDDSDFPSSRVSDPTKKIRYMSDYKYNQNHEIIITKSQDDPLSSRKILMWSRSDKNHLDLRRFIRSFETIKNHVTQIKPSISLFHMSHKLPGTNAGWQLQQYLDVFKTVELSMSLSDDCMDAGLAVVEQVHYSEDEGG